MNPGEWFMWSIDEPMSDKLKVYTGKVRSRVFVREISRHQAMAYQRHHGEPGVYYSYKDGNDRWRDVRVCGDIDAWFGEEDE